MKTYNCDIVIIGGGIVGLCIANQLVKRNISSNIIILDKEATLGLHTSGRNSGVIHAGLYYKPNSLKAKVCVSGSKRLTSWIHERNLPINKCGKVIVAQKEEVDEQLDILVERGRKNGAQVEWLDEKQLKEIVPESRTASGRAIWSPNTSVIKPLLIIDQLQKELAASGVLIMRGQKDWSAKPKDRIINLKDGTHVSYAHLINCSGLQADRIAHQFGIGQQYSLLPFKGLYWQIKKDCPIQPRCNLYPVPDLNIPFLGIHFTPSADINPIVSIGPTATPALGRENYKAIESIEPLMALNNFSLLAMQYLMNKGGFRNYVHNQAFINWPNFFIRAVQELIPSIQLEHIELSQKIGIRSQLFNNTNQSLEDDFLCLEGPDSTHVMNAISPAFTSSFALADLILDQANL